MNLVNIPSAPWTHCRDKNADVESSGCATTSTEDWGKFREQISKLHRVFNHSTRAFCTYGAAGWQFHMAANSEPLRFSMRYCSAAVFKPERRRRCPAGKLLGRKLDLSQEEIAVSLFETA